MLYKLTQKNCISGLFELYFWFFQSWSSKVKLLRNKSHGEIERKELNEKSRRQRWLKER